MIFSNYVSRKGDEPLKMRFREEVMEQQPILGPGEGEEMMKEVLGTMKHGKE